jgi:hypothetical protein
MLDIVTDCSSPAESDDATVRSGRLRTTEREDQQ